MWPDLSLTQPAFFPVDHAVRMQEKEAGYVRPDRPLFHAGRYHFQYKLKAITPCVTRVIWRMATLGYSQFFMVSSFSGTITLVISPLAAIMAR